MDDVDKAQFRMEQELEYLLQMNKKSTPTLHPVGVCYYCGTELESKTALYCDEECHVEHVKELQRLEKANRNLRFV